MNKKSVLMFFGVLVIASTLLTWLYFSYYEEIVVINAKGLLAIKERDLLVVATLLMLIVVIPVFVMTIVISWRYRSDNTTAKYEPNWDYSFLAEAIWWGVPCVIIAIIAYITWTSTHELDPFIPIEETDKKSMRIQVVALQWKWLFLYPEHNIATVNYLQFPEKTPIIFEITADAPMNSFWIPQLSGQIYAMPGMRTLLHLIANETGTFRGLSANISGKGFSGMTFNAVASPETEFQKWVESVKTTSSSFNTNAYQALAKPSEYNSVAAFKLEDAALFDQILMKYMTPIPLPREK